MRTIKKYKNRKLYDTSTSSYISLKDVAQIALQDKISVLTFDAQDITTATLLEALACSELGVNEVINVLNRYVE
jgi:polyhydroxyalkanoate synthesis regulator protein